MLRKVQTAEAGMNKVLEATTAARAIAIEKKRQIWLEAEKALAK